MKKKIIKKFPDTANYRATFVSNFSEKGLKLIENELKMCATLFKILVLRYNEKYT